MNGYGEYPVTNGINPFRDSWEHEEDAERDRDEDGADNEEQEPKIKLVHPAKHSRKEVK